MTEAGITSLKGSYAKEKSGSVGTLLAHVKMRLVDDNLKDVPAGESGEIFVSGPTCFMYVSFFTEFSPKRQLTVLQGV